MVNGLHSLKTRDDPKIYSDSKEKVNNINRLPPRISSSMQQHVLTKDALLYNDRTKSKTNSSIIRRQTFDSPINHYEPTASFVFEPSRIKTKLQRPQTAFGTRLKISDTIVDIPSHLNSRKLRPSSSYKKTRKKSIPTNRPQSASFISNQQHSNLTFESSTYSKTLFAGRPLSAVLQNHHRRSPVQQIVDPSCSIREAKGAASRYNNPEELFGIKPQELFGTSENQSKKIHYLKTTDKYMYQQDVDKLVNLYAMQHTSSYRPTVIPQLKLPANTTVSSKQSERHRKMSSSKGSVSSTRTSTNTRLSTLASLNISRRFPDNQRSTLKVVHT